MVDPSKPSASGQSGRGPVAGGCLTAIALIVGAVGGAALGQPSIGVLVGAVAGILISVAVWRWDRKR